jgi:hypothetical protein
VSAGVDWGGSLEALAKELETLPDRLLNDVVDPRMDQETARGEQTMRSGYGNTTLGDGIKREKRGPGEYVIKNTKPHAHLYELGTQNRVTSTGHRTGRMPAKPVLIPEAIHTRERIGKGITQDVTKLRSEHLEVTP